jgi:hypothetical protein
MRLARFGRLIWFGFEQIVLSRLFRRHAPIADNVTAALLKAKAVAHAPPDLRVTDQDGDIEAWSRGFSAVNAALYLNLRAPDEIGPRHARPAPAFRAIYLWDSAFIAQVWKWWDAETAWDVLSAVVKTRVGDRLQHFTSEFSRSVYTQPPLIAWSLQRLMETAEPEQFSRWCDEAYAPLLKYHAWLRENRRLSNGLYAWAHAYESGVENAPRFGDREERRLRDTRTIAAPDLCAYMVLQCEALAAIARERGETMQALGFERETEALRAAVNAHLWDERDGFYFDRTEDGAFIRSQTIASLMPLWAGIPTQAQARRLVEHVLDPGAFNTLIPAPSVAIADPDFERDMWRGPVWLNTAYAVVEGLKRYGYEAEASDFAYRLCDGVYRTYARTGRFYEFYDPTAYGIKELKRKRGNRWKAMTLGRGPVADFVGWTGLVNTMVVETLFGLRFEGGAPALTPRFPRRAQGRTFTLTLPAWDMHARLAVDAMGGARGEIRVRDVIHSVAAKSGETVRFNPAKLIGREAIA